ncbi:MAG: hypothetical protein MUC43_11945 [Pirellula sp.]|jgi:hypothetical protein|nr:hypothetical protein [Pirellula sp.]
MSPDQPVPVERLPASDVASHDDSSVFSETATSSEAAKRRKLTIRQTLSIVSIAVIMIAVAVALNRPTEMLRFGGTQYGKLVTFFHEGYTEEVPKCIAGGWPFEYYLRMGSGEATDLKLFSVPRLVLNIAMFSLSIAAMAYYRWNRFTSPRIDEATAKRWSVMDLLVLTSLCGAALIYWQLMTQRSKESHEIARQLYNGQGAVIVAPVIPAYLDGIVPELFTKMHERIVEVELNSPSDDLIRLAVTQPYLERFSVTGDNFTASELEPLVSNPRLWSMRVSGRQLKRPDELQMLGSMSQLRSLVLMRTTLTSEVLNTWTGLSRLKYLNLVHTNVELAKLSNPPWANQVETLFLPWPPSGVVDSLEIDGWKELKQLRVFEFEEPAHDGFLKISLANLPSLTSLLLNNHQKLDLSISNASRLANITTFRYEAELIGSSDYVPSSLWIRNLRLHDLPELKSFEVFFGDLEACSITSARSDFVLKVLSKVTASKAFAGTHGDSMPVEKRARAIQVLANSGELSKVQFSNFDFEAVSLEPLKESKSLSSLGFNQCQMDFPQTSDLAGSQSLRELSLEVNPANGAALNSLLKKLPKLDKIQIPSVENIKEFRLESHPLSQIVAKREMRQLNALRLIDLPNFEGTFGLESPIRHLHISNAPRLRGMIVNGLVPANSSLELGESLEILGLGGDTITDDVLPEFNRLGKLRKLSLVDSKLSEARLMQISMLDGLESLVIAGDQIGDELVSRIAKLPQLQRLEIATDNPIQAEVLEQLGELKGLRFLTLRIKGAETVDFPWVARLGNLEMLRFDGIKCTTQLIDTLSSLKKLVCVALEGTDLSREVLESISSKLGTRLARLGLQRSTVESTGFETLVEKMSGVVFELRDATIEYGLVADVMASNRLVTRYRDEMVGAQTQVTAMAGRYYTIEEEDEPSEPDFARIDYDILDPITFRAIASSRSGKSPKASAPAVSPRTPTPSSPASPSNSRPRPNSGWMELLNRMFQ